MPAPVVPETEPAGLLSDATLSDLQLDRQPFVELSEDDEPFADGTTNEQLSDIKQALITGDDLLLVLGEDGAGKSTLLAQLGANSGLRIQCFAVRGSDRFSTHNLFTGMLEAFKLAPPDELKDMLDALVPCLQGMVANNILSAIVLDNADNVTDGELTRLLSSMLYLNSQDETLLRVVLAADESFEDRIPELLPEGADLPYSSLSVEPLDDDRASTYLAHRLHQAGWMDALPFSDEEIIDINARAGGRPRLLHQEAAGVLETRARDMAATVPADAAHDTRFDTGFDTGLDRGADPGLEDIGHQPPPAAARRRTASGLAANGRGLKLALGAVAVALIGGGLWLSSPAGRTDDPASYTVVEQRPVESDAPDLRLVETRPTVAVDATPAAARPDAVEPVDAAAAGDPAPAPEFVPTPEPDPRAPAAEPAPVSTPAPTPDPGPVPAPASAPDPVASPAVEPSVEGRAPTDDELLEPLVTAQREGAPQDTTTPPASPETVPPTDPIVENPSTTGLEPSTWILLQDADRFTVQMSASTERASVENFLRRAELPGPNSIFAFDRDGTTWHALVHGLFPSIEQARAAVERMPAQAQSNQPWIRAVGRIQAVLREQN